MLEVKDLSVHYGMIQAVKDVSFTVNEGEIVSLIGANGAGKSTILKTLSGLVRPSAGTIEYLGQDITPNFNMKVSDMLFVKRIPLPADHLVMRQNGLFFLYQLDEIAGYVYGMPSFTLPYDKVMPFMTAEAVELIPQQKNKKNSPQGKENK